MAVTSGIEYCSDREVLDVFPNLSGFDLKRRIFGWNLGLSNFSDTTLDIYFTHNTGVISELFWDGAMIDELSFNTIKTTQLDGAMTKSATQFFVGPAHGLEGNDIVKVDNEYMRIVSVASDTISVSTPSDNRGLFNTNAVAHADEASVYRIIDESVDIGSATSAGKDALAFVYDHYLDMCLLVSTEADSPLDYTIESGDDWNSVKTRFRRKASRFVESMIDSRIAREISKDREGNYPEVIIRMTALKTVIFLLQANDPTNEFIDPFNEEFNELLAGIRNGHIVLPNQVTMDSSKGVIRTVTVGSSSDLFPIQLRGNYHGSGYELLKIKIESGHNGIIGVAKMTVYAKNSNELKVDKIIDGEIITGDFQTLHGGLQIRWSGDSVATAVCETNDEYEIELYGSSMDATVSNVGSVGLTRGGRGYVNHRRNR